MQGKYSNILIFAAAFLKRQRLRLAIAKAVSWSKLTTAQEGYTAIVGCKHEMLLVANVTISLLVCQKSPNLRKIILVVDSVTTPELLSKAAKVAGSAGSIPIEVLFYTSAQHALARSFQLPYLYSWLSWCIGISAAGTTHIMLQDLDAFLLADDILEDRYVAMVNQQLSYFGDSAYNANGILATDGLVTTWELFIDLPFLREAFEPIDLFNRVGFHGGRSVDYDTLLWCQTQKGKSGHSLIDRVKMVHPSQVVSQYTELQRKGRYVAPSGNNLYWIPYLIDLGGENGLVKEYTNRIRSYPRTEIPFLGHTMDTSALSIDHAAWIRVQIGRLEAHLFGGIRQDTDDYLRAIESLALPHKSEQSRIV